jgi:hypothetical protein
MRIAVVVTLVLADIACGLPATPAPLFSTSPSGDNPFPDERSQSANGIATSPAQLRKLLPNGVDTVQTDDLLHHWTDELATAGGWGVFAPVLVRFAVDDEGRALDAIVPHLDASIDAKSIAFVNLDETNVAPVDARATWHATPGVLELQPIAPVAANARIGCVLLRSLIKAHDLPRPPAFDALAHTANGAADVAKAASALHVSVDDVALLVAYRTHDPTRDLLTARDLVKDVVPAFSFADLHDGRHGVFTPANAPTSLTSHPDEMATRLDGAGVVAVGFYTSLDLRDASTHVFDADVLAGTKPPAPNQVEVVLVEPDASKFPPPWPAVILQHGFQGSNQFVVDNCAPFIQRGLAVIGISAVSSGERGPVTGFFNLTDPRTIRDNLRQTTIDHLVLSNLATKAHVDVDGAVGDDLDGSLAYYGHSMGAILGSSFAFVTEQADVVAVNAPGGGLVDVFRSSGLEDALQLLVRPLLGIGIDDPSYDDAFPLLTALAQPLLEGADPIAYARSSSRPHVLLQMDVGDLLVPNQSTLDLAGAAGVPLRNSDVAVDDEHNGLDAVVALDPAHYPDFHDPNDNPHGLFDQKPIQAQAAQFIATRGRSLIASP